MFPKRLKILIPQFPGLSGNKNWNLGLLGTVAGFVLALLIYEMIVSNTVNPTIHYNPADVIYGDRLHAVHSMGSNLTSQSADFISIGSVNKPKTRISEQNYDFGEVDAHQILTRTFVITNSGQSPLIIQRAYTTCGCTTADFTGTQIPPGKVVLMTLQFDIGFHDMRGMTVRRGVMVETNDPDHPTQEIWIQATVR